MSAKIPMKICGKVTKIELSEAGYATGKLLIVGIGSDPAVLLKMPWLDAETPFFIGQELTVTLEWQKKE